jgi:hypothetical protein
MVARKNNRTSCSPNRHQAELHPPPTHTCRAHSHSPSVRARVPIDSFMALIEANNTAPLLWDWLDLATHVLFARTHKRALIAGGLSLLFPDMDILSPMARAEGIPIVWRKLVLRITTRWTVPPGDTAAQFMKNTGYAFTSVDLNELEISSNSMVTIAVLKLKDLISLNMNECDYSANNYSFESFFHDVAYNSMKTLKTISLSKNPVTAITLQFMSRIYTLTHLNLHGTTITDTWLVHLSSLKLEHLCLARTTITNDGLEYLKELPLTHLNLSSTNIDSAGLCHLKDLKLTRLQLTRCEKILDLSPIAEMPLTHLNVSGCKRIGYYNFEKLLALPLVYINASGCWGLSTIMARRLLFKHTVKYADISFCENVEPRMNQNGHWVQGANNARILVETPGKPPPPMIEETCHGPGYYDER